MGRSVYVSPDAAAAVYFTVPEHLDMVRLDPDAWDEWWADDLAEVVRRALPSTERPRREYRHPEGRVLARNGHADVVVTEYCGVWALALIPNGDPPSGLALAWCERVNLARIVKRAGGEVLRLLGRASNGEAFYRRA